MSLAFLLIFYFFLAISVIALIVFPGLRARVGSYLRQSRQRVDTHLRKLFTWSGRTAIAPVSALGHSAKRISVILWQNRALAVIVIIVLLIPPAIALFNRDIHVFHLGQRSRLDTRIQALLTGERLAPPPALPPEVFTTQEVEQIRPNLARASRNWDLLDPEFRQRLLLVYKIMREDHGYDMTLIEGYRSPDRQDELAAMGANVTNARGYQSYHQYGLAADSAFMRNGKIVISEKDPWAMKGYTLYGETAEQVGLTWGGRWQMMDFGHVELRRPGARNRP